MSRLIDRAAGQWINDGVARPAKDVSTLTQEQALRLVTEGARLKSKVRTLDQPAMKAR